MTSKLFLLCCEKGHSDSDLRDFDLEVDSRSRGVLDTGRAEAVAHDTRTHGNVPGGAGQVVARDLASAPTVGEAFCWIHWAMGARLSYPPQQHLRPALAVAEGNTDGLPSHRVALLSGIS